MFIVHVSVRVRSNCIADFIEATNRNAMHSRMEPGVARFDVVQQSDNPVEFVLVEVYRTKSDAGLHKETDHYQRWRDTVESMMAIPRRSQTYQNISPDENGWQHL